MNLDALRLSAFRRFCDPAAIENFAPGVNVLAGPNEVGKSTFFHALEAAFVFRFKTTGMVLDAMRPFAGGEPLVEADFTQDGTRWRIRKQFGRGASAILTDLTAGRVFARNGEAEDRLAELVGRKSDLAGPLGLVWISQQRTLLRPDPDIDPESGKAKPRGEHSALADAIVREVEAAAGGDRLTRIRALTAQRLDVLLTPARSGPRKHGPLEIARRQRDETSVALDAAQRAASAAAERMQAISRLTSEVSKLSAPAHVTALKKNLAGLEAELLAEVRRRTKFDVARETLKACLSAVESAQLAAEAEAGRTQRIAVLESRRDAAAALESEIAALSEHVDAESVTPAALQRLASLQHEMDLASVEIASNAARVDVGLQDGGLGRVSIDGDEVTSDISRDVSEHLTIAVDGIATIRVTAPGADRAAVARRRHDEASKRQCELFDSLRVASLEEARIRAETSARNVDALHRARAKLSGLAPGGASALAAELRDLFRMNDAKRDAAAAPADDELKSRQAAAHVARAACDELKDIVRSEPDFRKLSLAVDDARVADSAAAQTLARLTMDVEKLKSEQAGADEDGRAGQVASLTQELERHVREVTRHEAEGKALLLLDATLKSIEQRSRDAFTEPVTRRLQPYLNEVFGDAALTFKDGFAVDGLKRADVCEDFSRLSDGTREQLSVLVRVAFAGLLASRGEAVPLILDDPLVYSDDARLGNVCRVLEQAARAVQVIVLTCRPSAFEKLSGHRVAITTWQPDK